MTTPLGITISRVTAGPERGQYMAHDLHGIALLCRPTRRAALADAVAYLLAHDPTGAIYSASRVEQARKGSKGQAP
jgi:hypothetical protein